MKLISIISNILGIGKDALNSRAARNAEVLQVTNENIK